MRWITRFVITVVVGFLGALSCSTRASSQQSVTLKEVFTTEGAVAQPVVSPDGRWVVYRVPTSDGTGSRLWIGSTNGGAPWPVTTEGHDDVVPRWAPAGDRIVFISTRPNRDGGSRHFAMVLDIDAKTGKAVGPPRQISLEPVEGASISFDGRWVAYTQRDTALRVKKVPLAGGPARLVGELTGLLAPTGFLGLSFDLAGSNVYLTTFRRGSKDGVQLWRFPLKGGRPEVMVQADHPILILPADPRYVIHYEMTHYYSVVGPGVARLKTVEGKEVGRITIPTYVGANLNGGQAWGLTAQRTDAPGEVRLVDLAKGTTRTLVVGGHWPEAWMPDGSAVITDRPAGESGGFIIETVPLHGGETRSVAVKEEVESGGWATAVGPYYSFRKRGADQQVKTGPTKFFSLDVRSGEQRLLADAALQIGISGPGGYENDGPRWMYATVSDDRLLLKSVDPGTGEARTIRSFDKTLAGKPNLKFAVHGTRVAALMVQGDSARLVLTEGDAPERTLATLPFKGERPEATLAWSRSGREIAVSISSQGAPAGVSVFEVPAERARPVSRRDFPITFSYCCDGIQWLPDDSALLAVAGGASNDASLLLFPVRNGGQPRPVATDVTGWEFILSPDGKHAVYQRDRIASTTIWSASFKGAVTP